MEPASIFRALTIRTICSCFIRRRLNAADGIVAGQTYQVNFSLTFASNAQSGCGGAGGTPGEDVWLKAGASPAEPLTILETTGLLSRWLRMNVDIGAQSQGGIAASVTGNIANGQTCDLFSKPFVTVQRTRPHTSLVNANSKGELWLLVGTDSGFEGLTSLYYQRIDASLVPVSQPPPPVLFSERGTGRAIALDSVTLMKEPFSVGSAQNFSLDQHTRVTVFGYDLELKNGENLSAITAQAEDSQARIHLLPVEAMSEVPNFGWITQVTVKLPDELQGVGDVLVSVSLRGEASNKVPIFIR